jgi:hypothetical protein
MFMCFYITIFGLFIYIFLNCSLLGVRKVSTVTRVGPNSSTVTLEEGGLSYSSYMNKTLDILDLGCGTGSAGKLCIFFLFIYM